MSEANIRGIIVKINFLRKAPKKTPIVCNLT